MQEREELWFQPLGQEAPLEEGTSLAGACWAQTEDPSGCGAASPSQGRWDPDSLRPALRLPLAGSRPALPSEIILYTLLLQTVQ